MGKRKSRNNGNSSNHKDSKWLWLWAVKNNNSPDANMNRKKAGKWFLSLREDFANAAWSKIQTAVTEGKLWCSCMSEPDPGRPIEFLTIMVFTQDPSDVSDAIRVLDYLESSEIKPHDVNIKYVKGMNTTISTKNWLYSSNLIRTVGDSIQHIYEYDILKSRLLTDSVLCPTETLESDFEQLHAKNNKYTKRVDPKKVGKWTIILPKNSVDAVWNKIKIAVTNGELWRCSVSTTDPERLEQSYLVSVFTKDYTDLKDVICVLDYLENSGIKPPSVNLKYTTENKPVPCTYTSDTVRSVVSTQFCDSNTYEFDIYKKEVVTDCKVYPTEGSKRSMWLIAKNNKYTDEEIDADKMGKWMLFLPENRVNTAWDRIKEAVARGALWFAKVCTDHKKSSGSCYTVFVYTIDYSDQSDVLCVHEHLASSRIKPPNVIIKYKTLQQSLADSQSHVSQKLYMYTSKTIQALNPGESSAKYTYKFDIYKNELVTDCDLNPTEASEVSEWLFAGNNKHIDEKIDPEKIGKWMVFLPVNKVNAAWKKVKEAVAKGQLWSAKVSTTPDENGNFAFFIKTKDYTDLNDVIHTLACLESFGIKLANKSITYKTEQQSQPSASSGAKQKLWMYCSNTVRSLAPAQPKNDSICDTYEFDIDKKKLVTDCKKYPAEMSKLTPWLTAKNNKYKDEEIEVEKVGMWMLFLPKTSINETWDKIKMAVILGELWTARVATKPETSSFRGFYAVHIYTKDYSDRKDVIRVLDYLESSKIKAEDAVLKYSPEQARVDKGGKKKSWMYSSDTIRSMSDLVGNV